MKAPTPITETLRQKALDTAKESNSPTYKHGCIVYRRGRVVAAASNAMRKTSPQGSGPHGTAHAEVAAIRKARSILHKKTLKGYSIYVVRINWAGKVKSSKPCVDCMKLIEKYELKASWSE